MEVLIFKILPENAYESITYVVYAIGAIAAYFKAGTRLGLIYSILEYVHTSFIVYVAPDGIPHAVLSNPADDVSTLFEGTNRKSILTVLSIILIRPSSRNSGTTSTK
jgi:hypothetical protein